MPRADAVSSPANRPRLADADLRRLYDRSHAARWGLDASRFADALHVSLDRACPVDASRGEQLRHAGTLHLEDLALACACAEGLETAWDHFVRELRPVLYRAADALDPSGSARELADSLYGDLYGLPAKDGSRRSLLTYYHGRSTLSTWLRAVLSQRVVDRARERKRLEPLPEEPALPAKPEADPDRPGLVARLSVALLLAISRLDPRDRLRLGYYYRQQLTLAQVGRLLGEHEATASRQLARTRRQLRDDVTRQLEAQGLSGSEIAHCFEAAAEDAGSLDLGQLLATADVGKNSPAGRSS